MSWGPAPRAAPTARSVLPGSQAGGCRELLRRRLRTVSRVQEAGSFEGQADLGGLLNGVPGGGRRGPFDDLAGDRQPLPAVVVLVDPGLALGETRRAEGREV